MSDLYPEELKAKEFLEMVGLHVTPVPRSNVKTPEFIVTNDCYGYVVEVKSRKDSELWSKALSKGVVAEEVRKHASDRWVTDVARKAKKQMEKADPDKKSLWILWLSIDCSSASETMFFQAIGSLFGARDIVTQESRGNSSLIWTCLYAAPSTFECIPQICAAVVASDENITLCVNEDSVDLEKFKQTKLYNTFAIMRPPISHSDLVNNRNYLTVKDSGLERRNEKELLNFLSNKYKLNNPLFIDMKTYSATKKISA
ncbi:hypothetical protein RUK98_003461 [Vibrio cholerae]|nr:hypothetical protein [Vibrio cholerae]ELJ8717755.1 hypothetical protein [Vibrio cholerae]HDI3200742.1 hypothetical protein [Vibrio cholerae]HDI3231765.1 hypothetical protein [Vibrio cholerae]HDI3305034.1 hypothetical protein [Vibrio cholerae]